MKRLWSACLNSLSGLKMAYHDEASFREEVWCSAILIPAGFFLAPDNISLLFMEGSVLLVLIVELLNTGIESAINRVGLEIHPFAKKAKDTASAAVFLSLIYVGLVWGVVLADSL